MPPTERQFTASAGIYFIAYKIALLGFVPALVRHGMRGIDLFAANADGSRTVGIQVRSSSSARKAEPGDALNLQFPLTHGLVEAAAENAIFCFVDLRLKEPSEGPDVYVVPAKQVKQEYAGVYCRRYSYVQHQRSVSVMEQFRNNWHPLLQALTGEVEEPEPTPPPRNLWVSEIETSQFL